MLTGTDLQVLRVIGDREGKSALHTVASAMRISSDYARIICRSLGTADYIDLRRV